MLLANYSISVFQQDGATCLTGRGWMRPIRSALPDRLITKYGALVALFSWSVRIRLVSLGILKINNTSKSPGTIQALKEWVRAEVVAIQLEMLGNVIGSFATRLQEYMRQNGGQLSIVIFMNWTIVYLQNISIYVEYVIINKFYEEWFLECLKSPRFIGLPCTSRNCTLQCCQRLIGQDCFSFIKTLHRKVEIATVGSVINNYFNLTK